MTVSRNDIQKLITEIDPLLRIDEQNPDHSEDSILQQQAAVLEKVRWYLGDLSRQVEVPGTGVVPLAEPEQQTATAIAQAVMAQMNLQRQDWLQPMQLELESLRQQRETLRREVRHLETHQRQMSHDLLQTVMHRCSEALKEEVATVFDQMQGQFNAAIAGTEPGSTGAPAFQQLDWIAKLRSLEQQADQLFLSLDHTFHQVFDSLEQDVQSYHQSLNQKLEDIHELQQQTVLAPASLMTQVSEATVSGMATETATMQPLQLDASRPLPALELLEGAIAHPSSDPVEQILHLDLPQPPPQNVSSRSTTEEAWEAWDEYLFTHDPTVALPVVAPEPDTTTHLEPGSRDLTPSAAHPIAPVSPQQPLEELNSPIVEDVPRSLPQEVQQELFGRLSDPAQGTEPEPLTDAPTTQPVETILFGDPVVEPEVPNLEIAPEPEATDPDGPTLEETIASLDGLLEQVAVRMAEVDPPTEALNDSDLDEKISPGETLLTTEEVATSTATTVNPILDDQQLQQLATDLAQFEDSTATEIPPQPPEDAQLNGSTPAAVVMPAPSPQPEVAAPETTTVQMSEPVAEVSSSAQTERADPELTDADQVVPSDSVAPNPVDVPEPPTEDAAPNPAESIASTPSPSLAAQDAPESSVEPVAPAIIPELHTSPLPEPITPEPIATQEVTAIPETTSVASPAMTEAGTIDDIPDQAVVTVLSDLNWEQEPQELPTATDNMADPDGDLWSSTAPQTVQASPSS